jgi:hypothetical protein
VPRATGIAIVFLAALTIIQFVALRRTRVELATLRAQAAAIGIDARRDEMARAGQWLHTWLESPDGGSRAGGLCPGGAPDMNAIAVLVFDTYLHARAAGSSETAAREAVLQRARSAR